MVGASIDMPVNTEVCCCCRCCSCSLRWSEPSLRNLIERNSSKLKLDQLSGQRDQEPTNGNIRFRDDTKKLLTRPEANSITSLSSEKIAESACPRSVVQSDSGDNEDDEIEQDIRFKRKRQNKQRVPLCASAAHVCHASVESFGPNCNSMKDLLRQRVSWEMMQESSSRMRQERTKQRIRRAGQLITAAIMFSNALALASHACVQVKRLFHFSSLSHDEMMNPENAVHDVHGTIHDRITESLIKLVEHKTEDDSSSEDERGAKRRPTSVYGHHHQEYSIRDIGDALELPQALVQVISIHHSRRKDFHRASNKLVDLMKGRRHLTVPQLQSLEQQYEDVVNALHRSGQLLEKHLPVALKRRIKTLSLVFEEFCHQIRNFLDECEPMQKISKDLHKMNRFSGTEKSQGQCLHESSKYQN